MTISTEIRKAGPYTGNEVTVEWPFTFKVFEGSDLMVVLLDTTLGTEQVLTLGSQYTVVLNADQEADPGGVVNYPATGAPMGTGYQLVILSAIAILQPTDIVNAGGFYPQVIEDALDRVTIIAQQLEERGDRTLQLPISVSSSVSGTLPTPESYKLLSWDAAGQQIVNVDPAGVYTDAIGDVVSTVSDFSIDATTPDRRVPFASTTAGGWNATAGEMRVEFDWISNAFFTENPGAHVAVVLRCDTSVIATAVRGNGALFGSFIGAQESPAYAPTTMLETWFNGLGAPGTQRYLIPGTEGFSDKLLEDGVQYKMVVSSTVQTNGAKYIRYQLFRYNSTYLAWDLERDTGDALDLNTWIDATKTGLVFGYVFENPSAGPWSIDVTNVKITWGPPRKLATQVPTWLRVTADASAIDTVNGNLTFAGTAARQLIDTQNATLNSRFAFQDKNTNQATSVMLLPNGTATTSNVFAMNTSNPGAAFQYIEMKIAGSVASIDTFQGNGAAQLDWLLKRNGSTIATVKSDGFRIVGGTVSIGVTGGLTGWFNESNSNAATFVTNSFDLNTVCGVDQIVGFFAGGGGGSPTGYEVETVLRPLYCAMAVLIKDLRARKVI